VETADGKIDDALRTFETCFSFSRHVGHGQSLINNLVGIACAAEAEYALGELVQRPDAPNLYWVLTDLPRPLVDVRLGNEFEQRVWEMDFPELAAPETNRSESEWKAILARICDYVNRASRTEAPAKHLNLDPATIVTKSLPAARKYLTEHGWSQAQVQSMSPEQMAVLAISAEFHEYRDDCFKAINLPFPEAMQFFNQSVAKLNAAAPTEAVQIARLFLPPVRHSRLAAASLQRTFDMLRTIEALRLHAAANEGRLPDRLEDVREASIPRDALTGKQFEYRRDGDSATLISRVPEDLRPHDSIRYKITIRK
jgi:hypothetical protein